MSLQWLVKLYPENEWNNIRHEQMTSFNIANEISRDLLKLHCLNLSAVNNDAINISGTSMRKSRHEYAFRIIGLLRGNPSVTDAASSERVSKAVALVFPLLLAWISWRTIGLPVIWDATPLMWRHSKAHVNLRNSVFGTMYIFVPFPPFCFIISPVCLLFITMTSWWPR